MLVPSTANMRGLRGGTATSQPHEFDQLLSLTRITSNRLFRCLILVSCLAWVLFLPASVYALDSSKRVTQYIHNSWRTQDGSLPAGMFSITQTSDGFLCFLSLPGDVYRFDGIRFLPWRLPSGAPINTVGKVYADHAGGLWVAADELVHVKDGVVTSHFQLEGIQGFQSISEDPDGSLWIGATRVGRAPLPCHRPRRQVFWKG